MESISPCDELMTTYSFKAAQEIPFNNQPYSIELTVPSHSVLYIQPIVNSLVMSENKQKPRKETKDTESFIKEHEK